MCADEPEPRIGDRERRAVDERLMAAVGDGVLTLAEYEERSSQVWQSRTRRDLDAVVADLPGEELPREAPTRGEVVTRRPTGLARRVAGAVTGSAVALGLGAVAVAVVLSGTDGRSVFGSTTTFIGPDVQDAAVSVLFGSVEVVVPDGARVDTTGLVVFGSTDCEVACSGGGDGQVVELRTLGGFGSVEIMTQSEYDARG